ncbi:MAG: hypothetical protein IJ160_14200 [Muribaculaceae bacterium]|nr:hypothetical protein [Muribaculaceae bacterium]
MKIDERNIDWLNGRTFMTITGILLAIMAVLSSGRVPVAEAGSGIFFEMPTVLVEPGLPSALINVACLVGIGALMLLINKVFSFVRSMTSIFVSAFFLLEFAVPATSSVFNTGTALCLILVLGVLALFASYEDLHSQGRIYLTMTILATACLWQWAFLILIPAFAIGFMYMRAMDFRGFLAMLLGLATPFWIVIGLGIVNPATDFKPLAINAVWATLDLSQTRLLVGWAAVVAVLSLVLTVMNLSTILNYRLQFRVYNAFFIVVTLLSVLAMCIDYRDMLVFLPLLNLCLAIQLAHTFTLSTQPKRHYVMWAFVAATLAVGISSLTL